MIMKKILSVLCLVTLYTAYSQADYCQYGNFDDQTNYPYNGIATYFSSNSFEDEYFTCDYDLNQTIYLTETPSSTINDFNEKVTFVDNNPSVSGGFDPELYALNVFIPRAMGNYAIKLNNRESSNYDIVGINNTFSGGNAEDATVGQSTVTLSFKYSIIASNPTSITNDDERPRFIAGIPFPVNSNMEYLGGQLSITIDESNPIFKKAGSGSQELLYTGWQCVSFTIPSEYVEMDPDFVFFAAISDSYSGSDFATVYIDDLCFEEEVECPCQYCLYIDDDVTGSVNDYQQAEHCINATNAIESGSSAIYHAGTEVVLKGDFKGLYGSTDHFYIEGCSGNFAARPTASNNNENDKAESNSEDIINNSNKEFRVYPNPAQNELNIVASQGMSITKMSLYSIDGKLILQAIPNGNTEVNTIDISTVSKGIYLLNIETNDGKVTSTKVVKN